MDDITIDTQPRATVVTVPIVVNVPPGRDGERGERGPPGEQGPIGDTGPEGQPGPGTEGRLLLQNDKTYFVATTGNDTNPGTFTAPFKTIQKAVMVGTQDVDSRAYKLGIQLANGTYNENVFVKGSLVGGMELQISGNGADPSLVVIASPGPDACFTLASGAVLSINSCTVTNPNGFCFTVVDRSDLQLEKMVFGDAQGHINLTAYSRVFATNLGYTITAIQAGFNHLTLESGSVAYINTNIEIPNPLTYTYFLLCQTGSTALFEGMTFTGAGVAGTVGIRYLATDNSYIGTGGNGVNFLPGSVPGTVDVTSMYDGNLGGVIGNPILVESGPASPITGLPAAVSPLDSTEPLPLVQAGVTTRVTAFQVATCGNNTISGTNASAFGFFNTVSGDYCYTIGFTNSLTMSASGQSSIYGQNNIVVGDFCHVHGDNNDLSNIVNFRGVLGSLNTVWSEAYYVIGNSNTDDGTNIEIVVVGFSNSVINSSGGSIIGVSNIGIDSATQFSIVGNSNTVLQMNFSYILGDTNTINSGDNLVAIGSNHAITGVPGDMVAIGNSNTIDGLFCYTLGFTNSLGYLTDGFLTALGSNNILEGDYLHVLGDANDLSGYFDHRASVGTGNINQANSSYSLGRETTITQNADGFNLALGYQAAIGAADYCIAMGYQATASTGFSIAIGYQALVNFAGTGRTIAIGYQAEAEADNAIAFGYLAIITGTGTNAIAIGPNATTNSPSSIAIGDTASVAGDFGVAIGYQTTADAYCIAIGYQAVAGPADYSTAIGYQTTANATHACAFLHNAIANIDFTINIGATIIVRKADGTTGDDCFWAYSGAEVIIETDEIDLTVLATQTVNMPAGGHFYPNEVGLKITQVPTGFVSSPDISFGYEGPTLAGLLASTFTSLINQFDRQRFQVLLDSNGHTQLNATVTVAANATTMFGRFYWKGIFEEDQ